MTQKPTRRWSIMRSRRLPRAEPLLHRRKQNARGFRGRFAAQDGRGAARIFILVTPVKFGNGNERFSTPKQASPSIKPFLHYPAVPASTRLSFCGQNRGSRLAGGGHRAPGTWSAQGA